MSKENKGFKEIAFLKDWSLTILNFLSKKNGDYKLFADASKTSLENFPDKANSQMIKGLREGFRDFNEMAKYLSPIEFQELNEILNKKFGKNIETFEDEKVVAKIIKIGKIISDLEFKIIEDKVNFLCQNDSKSTNLITLNNLLTAYVQ